MNRPMIKKGILKILAWSGLTVLCAVVALAQDQAPAAGQRSDGQIEMDVVPTVSVPKSIRVELRLTLQFATGRVPIPVTSTCSIG